MLLRIFRKRRAISPVVTTLFLFAVIIGAIAVSLGIIYPQMRRLNDQTKLETAGSTLISLDRDVRTLISNGVESRIFKEIDAGRGGTLRIDQASYSNITMYDGIYPINTFTIPHDRFQIIQSVDTNYIEEGTASYLIGGSNQNYFFLNSTTKQFVSWSIINQSRDINSDDVLTSLSYRNLLQGITSINEEQLQVNVTLEIQMINMSIPIGEASQTSGMREQIEIRYLGPVVDFTNWTQLSDDFSLHTATYLSNGDNIPFNEVPFYSEAPLGEGSKFSVRLKFIYHTIEVVL